jgi:hypothetical protein
MVSSPDDLAFLGLDTSDKNNPFGTLDDQLDPFWDEDITGVSAIVVLTHKWPIDDEVNEAGQSLAKFIDGRQLLVLDGHNHPRGTKWETNATLSGIVCFRSTVISCKAPRGTGHVVTWNGNGFDCEAVRGEYEKPKLVVMPVSKIKLGTQQNREMKAQSNGATLIGRNAWVKCKCGMSERRSKRICSFCGEALRNR